MGLQGPGQGGAHPCLDGKPVLWAVWRLAIATLEGTREFRRSPVIPWVVMWMLRCAALVGMGFVSLSSLSPRLSLSFSHLPNCFRFAWVCDARNFRHALEVSGRRGSV